MRRTARKRVLLTGFETFGGHDVNPSAVVARRIAAAPPPGVDVRTLVLPVSWARAFGPVRAALSRHRFDAVLLMGLAADRNHLEFERFALNWRGAAHPDEDGVAEAGSAIDPSGPAACLATAPLDELVAACAAAGAPARTSNHAGTFLCNQVLYMTLRHCTRAGGPAAAGFLHLPPFDGRGVPEDVQARAVAAAVVRLAASAPPRALPSRKRARVSRVQRRSGR